MKFMCDQMLGSLAKWLRILGFDTYFANNKMTDNELLNIAFKENRVLISRDKELIIRGNKKKIKTIELISKNLDDQLRDVFKNFKINYKNILSRCILCNTLLINIKKNMIKDKVPELIFENNEKFWFCKKCDKVYWTGSHYDKIKLKINEIKNY